MNKPMITPSTVDIADDTYRDNWIQTYTGRQFFPFRPEDSEVVIEDIAHHLSLICRFTGACRVHYSVAQHSVIVSQLSVGFEKWGLLHDAEEYVTNDVSSPIKPGMTGFREFALPIKRRILWEFGIKDAEEPAIVKHADLVAVATEARDLMPNAPTVWRLPVKPFEGMIIQPWSPKEAERKFLDRFHQLWR